MPLFVAFFWVIVLVIDTNKNNSKRFLAFFLSLTVLNYYVHALFFNHQYTLYIFFDSLWVFTSLAGYPLYYFYIRLLTKDDKFRWRWMWIAIPSILLALFSTIIYVFMSAGEKEIFIQGVMYHKEGYTIPTDSLLINLQLFRMLLFKIIFLIQVVLVLFFGIKHIHDYNVDIRHYYSNVGEKDLSPIKWLLVFLVFASLVSMTSNFIGKDFFIENRWLLFFPSLTHSIYLFGIGYFGYKQNFTIENFERDIKENEKIRHKEFEDDAKTDITNSEYLKDKLIELLEVKQIFKQTDLRITDVAFLLNTNRTYISKIINEDLQTNFSKLINQYRIKSAKTQLQDCNNDSLSLREIAQNSGFSSDSSFYRIFKNSVGVPPGDFRKKKCLE